MNTCTLNDSLTQLHNCTAAQEHLDTPTDMNKRPLSKISPHPASQCHITTHNHIPLLRLGVPPRHLVRTHPKQGTSNRSGISGQNPEGRRPSSWENPEMGLRPAFSNPEADQETSGKTRGSSLASLPETRRQDRWQRSYADVDDAVGFWCCWARLRSIYQVYLQV